MNLHKMSKFEEIDHKLMNIAAEFNTDDYSQRWLYLGTYKNPKETKDKLCICVKKSHIKKEVLVEAGYNSSKMLTDIVELITAHFHPTELGFINKVVLFWNPTLIYQRTILPKDFIVFDNDLDLPTDFPY
jgi:hypothetical protein